MEEPQEQQWRRQYRRANVVALIVLAAALGVLSAAHVSWEQPDGVVLGGRVCPTLCVHRMITDRPCPGCGITRGVVALFDGDIARASEIHPSAPWVGAWLLVQALLRLLLVLAPPRWPALWIPDLTLSIATLLLVTYAPLVCLPFLHTG